ncbi:hypothetical protein [Glaesserella parasuis]|uniref:hypothetical protein n=1 Tax=Glaesserella parasuis TaxID=738 RepID=UPI0021C0587B|nr:hypothetical protein [Glaesserella parasuis]MCT8835807.1 hypothetical protein [Glaesserella parasuis]MDG6231646.1 hypothetical protein [Glaesserella parasuis]MDG6300764.1 hypothetical protein [Glaesserella parasuis]MDG6375986.1 hypothetical protein [Glaesserella parasuis]MDG6471322.1 hypothetical protein [Glaesserella parasuis]
MNESLNPLIQPDQQGNFGKHGGKISHPQLAKALEEIEQGFRQIIDDPEFIAEMKRLQATYVGRSSPIYHARTLSKNGAQIYLKREDLNHTGAHKINHCIGEVLLAKN